MIDIYFTEGINECMNHMEVDYLPLHDIFRSFYGFWEREPDKTEFSTVLEAVNELLTNRNVICLIGKDMVLYSKPTSELLDYLRTEFAKGNYQGINYGVWFDTRQKLEKQKNANA
jgi:hypothetical protein